MRRLLAVQLLLSSFFVQHTLAQKRNTELRGRVIDPSGAPIASAVVRLVAPDAASAQTTISDEEGRFHFSGPTETTCRVEVTYPGFRNATVDCSVKRQKGGELLVHLELATVETKVHVTPDSAEGPDPSANPTSITIADKLLSQLPVLDGDYVASLSTLLDRSAVGPRGATIIVDGLEVSKAAVPEAAVSEVRINDDTYSAEFREPGEGRIEITTKATAEDFHGSIGLAYRDATLAARDAFASARPPEQRLAYDATLDGPLWKHKDGFLVSYEQSSDNMESYIYAVGAAGLIQEGIPNPIHETHLLSKWMHTQKESHHASIQYNLLDFSTENAGVGGLVLASAAIDDTLRRDDLTFGDDYVVSPHMQNQLHVRFERFRYAIQNENPSPMVVVEGSFTGGGAQSAQINTQYIVSLNDSLSWVHDKHTFKVGVSVPNWSNNTLTDWSNFGGTYYFSDLSHYRSSQPYLLTWQSGNPQIRYTYREIGGFLQDEIALTSRLALLIGLRFDRQSYLATPHNLAPRFSFAYALDDKGRMLVRGGAGIFYDHTGALPMADLLRYDGSHLQQYSLSNPPASGVPTTALASEVPSNIVILGSHAQIPYAFDYSLAFEYRIAGGSAASITYRGSRGVHLFRSIDTNAPPPPQYLSRPNPSLGIVREIRSDGRQHAAAFDLSLRQTIGKVFSAQAKYTLSWTENNTSGISYFPSSMFNSSGEWGPADYDQRHQFNLFGSFQAKRWLSGGVILSVMSGRPYTVTTGVDTYNDGMDNARPPGVARNSLRGAVYESTDLHLAHDFVMTRQPTKEKAPRNLTVAIDAFNMLNHVNYNTYVGALGSPFFGKPVSSFPARRIQVSARFKF
jgi:hypothetical protein